jgi:hypothetical protein
MSKIKRKKNLTEETFWLVTTLRRSRSHNHYIWTVGCFKTSGCAGIDEYFVWTESDQSVHANTYGIGKAFRWIRHHRFQPGELVAWKWLLGIRPNQCWKMPGFQSSQHATDTHWVGSSGLPVILEQFKVPDRFYVQSRGTVSGRNTTSPRLVEKEATNCPYR